MIMKKLILFIWLFTPLFVILADVDLSDDSDRPVARAQKVGNTIIYTDEKGNLIGKEELTVEISGRHRVEIRDSEMHCAAPDEMGQQIGAQPAKPRDTDVHRGKNGPLFLRQIRICLHESASADHGKQIQPISVLQDMFLQRIRTGKNHPVPFENKIFPGNFLFLQKSGDRHLFLHGQILSVELNILH